MLHPLVLRLTLLVVTLLGGISAASAVDCGKTMNDSQIKVLDDEVKTADANLSEHRKSLSQEQRALLDRRSAGIDEISMLKIESEDNNVSSALDISARLGNALAQALLLAQVRDVMVDRKDRERVGVFLSHMAVFVGNTALRSIEGINRRLIMVSRPGIATDLAKLRDSISEVANAFKNCEAPQIPTKR